MKTLIIYDNTGKIFYQVSGSLDVLKEPNGIPYLLIDMQEGKRVTGVDISVTPNVAILEDLPKSETKIMQEQIDNLNLALAELMGV